MAAGNAGFHLQQATSRPSIGACSAVLTNGSAFTFRTDAVAFNVVAVGREGGSEFMASFERPPVGIGSSRCVPCQAQRRSRASQRQFAPRILSGV
jgi:hypothetical protein